MAFPFIFESNFETGDNTEWDSETDTVSQLSVKTYKELAKLPFVNSTPFSGANAALVELTGGTADAFFTEGDVNYALDATGGVRFTLCLMENFTATADDILAILELQSTSNVVEISVGLRITASSGLIEIGIGKLAPTAFGPGLERGKHYTIEVDFNIDAGGGNDGDASLYITKENEAVGDAVASLSALNQLAVTHAVLGVQDHLATTTGEFILSDFTADDLRLYPRKRFPSSPLITKSGHLFIGHGHVEGATILSENADDSVDFYDTDDGDINQEIKN